MILKNLFKNKRGIIKRGFIWTLLAIALLSVIIISQQISADLLSSGTKSNQYVSINRTCESFLDSV
jgi:preprotein translocase subunit SecG